LTTTPMLCALLRRDREGPVRSRPVRGCFPAMVSRVSRRAGAGLDWLAHVYNQSLGWAIAHPRLILAVLLATVALNVTLFAIVPKSLFPQQDSGLMGGGITADQSISFPAMNSKMRRALAIVQADPAVQTVVGFTGGRGTNQAMSDITLKPLDERDASAFAVMARLRPRLAVIPGAQLMMFPRQDLSVGGRMSFAQYQYTLQADSSEALRKWTTKLNDALKTSPALVDVSSDQQYGGLATKVVIDRPTAARYGLTPDIIDATLYDAFGERAASTIYRERNQYHVVMELAPRFLEDPESLRHIYVSTSGQTASGTSSTNAAAGTMGDSSSGTSTSSASNQATNSIATGSGSVSSGQAVSTSGGTMVPLAAFARLVPATTPVSVNHQGQAVAATISFNLAPGHKFSEAADEVDRALKAIHAPVSVHGAFSGTAGKSLAVAATMPLLILAALLTVYLVLGMLYESYVHPVTILSTLPSAGVGAVLALMLTGTEHSDDRAHPSVPVDRHRQEERHHDGGLCPRGREREGNDAAGCHPGSLSPTLPTHHDDHLRGALRSHTPGARSRHGRGTATPARHFHHRRLDRQPAPYAVHHPGGLSVP
jgi:multidrug efflux pump